VDRRSVLAAGVSLLLPGSLAVASQRGLDPDEGSPQLLVIDGKRESL